MNDATLKHLAVLSENLNRASDALSKQIASVEEALNELKLGVWAWVEVRRIMDDESFKVDGKPEQVTRVESLGYGKYRGKWGLLYATDFDEYPGDEYTSITLLRDAPRLERLAAVEKIPALINELDKSADDVMKRANDQAAKVGAVAVALRKVGKNHDR